MGTAHNSEGSQFRRSSSPKINTIIMCAFQSFVGTMRQWPLSSTCMRIENIYEHQNEEFFFFYKDEMLELPNALSMDTSRPANISAPAVMVTDMKQDIAQLQTKKGRLTLDWLCSND